MEWEIKGPVCVTGAGGYIASWLVKLLLSNGYKVHGTVRDPCDEKNAHLKKLDKAFENLQLFKAELLDYDSLLPTIVGCDGVFHTASPVPFTKVPNPEILLVVTWVVTHLEWKEVVGAPPRRSQPPSMKKLSSFLTYTTMQGHAHILLQHVELFAPAVTGTLNVLKACSEVKVKRVIFVSSASSVVMNPEWPLDKPMDENCWSDKEYCKTTENWYSLSKTMAEEEALNYAKENGLDVITVLPCLVAGPLLQTTINATSLYLINILKGVCETMVNSLQTLVDVRDVAEALLLTYEKREAAGRYICASFSMTRRDFVDKLKSMFPNFEYPKSFTDGTLKEGLVSDKLKALGWRHRTMEETLADAVKCFQVAGHI